MPPEFHGRDVISIHHLNREEIQHILKLALFLKKNPHPDLLRGVIMGSCFFEPSTRTRVSFEAAMYRLGGNVVGFNDVKTTSFTKGESLYDTIKIIGQCVDVVVLRHTLEGAVQWAAKATDKPVINAGDGTNQHPTQTFLDLFTIQECQGTLDELHIALVGDLKHGRTVHSLAQACSHFRSRLYFVSPPGLQIPEKILTELREKNIRFSLHENLDEILQQVDILYVTRIQEERFADRMEFQRVRDHFILTPDKLGDDVKANLKVLHPLPRVNEISREMDTNPHAYYFQQAYNGLYVRQALLGLVLGKL